MWNYILSFFRRKPLQEPTEGELQIIRIYAQSRQDIHGKLPETILTETIIRDQATSIYNKYIKLRDKYIELQWMSEVTSKYPDLALQIILRSKLIEIEHQRRNK